MSHGYAGQGQTVNVTVSGPAISAGTQSGNTGTIVFSNSNGLTFGMSNSSVVTGSYTVPSTAGLISAVNVSAGTTSNNLTACLFMDSNGLAFGLDGSTITGSYTQSTHSHSTAPAAISAGTTQAIDGTVVFSNSNGVSFGMDAGTVTASYTQSTHSHSTAPEAIAAGTQTATSGTVVFSNSNGISFGMSGSSQVTASYTVPSTAGLLSAVNLSAGTTSNNLSAFVLSNSNGVSFGLNGSTVTASVTGAGSGTTASAVSNANVVGTNTGRYANEDHQHAGIAAAGVSNVGGTQGNTGTRLGTIVLSGGNAISLSQSTNASGATIGINFSTQYPGAFPMVISAPGASTNYDTVSFENANNVTFGGAAGLLGDPMTITASAAVKFSAGTQSSLLSAITFANSNSVTFGLSAGTITASINAAGGGLTNVNLSAGTTSQNLSAFVFSNSNNVSFGLNGSTVTASASQSPAYTALTFQNRQLGASTTLNSMAGQNSMWISPFRLVAPVSVSTVLGAIVSFSGTITSAATAQNGGTVRFAIYSQNATNSTRFDTLWTDALSWTFWNSGTSSYSYAISGSGGNTTGSSAGSNLGTQSIMGVRHMYLSPGGTGTTWDTGLYAWAILASTSSAGYSAAMSREALYMDNPMSVAAGSLPGATNNSIGFADAGTLRTTTGALPASFGFSDIGQQANLNPFFKMGCI